MARSPSIKGDELILAANLSEVLFEFRPVGNILRVIALDPKTGIEIIMVADPRYGSEAIKRLAARKLAYVITKKKANKSPESNNGILV